MSDTIFGIDLGTTNSCLAVMDRGAPRIIDIDGIPTVPSVVSLDPDTGDFVVGARARNRMALYPELTVASIKRRMGETDRVQLGDQALLPEEISAEILRYLKTEGSKAIGKEIRRAVITVPAYFEDAQRRATIRAGELAGLEVVRIINEPTAAALVYEGLDQRRVDAAAGSRATAEASTAGQHDHRNLLVFDLGGGTFDVSVVRLSGEVYSVCASCGDTHLGGDDFDLLIVDSLLEHIQEEHDADLSGDPRAMARLREAAERAKIELSTKPYTDIMEEALGQGVDLRYELERTAFELLIEGHLEKTLVEVERAFHEAGMEPADADRVVLVGGSTRIPRVIGLLEDKLERPVEHSLDPDLCVALGAAVQGAVIGGEAFDRILIDVSAHSLGIKTVCRDFDAPVWMPGAENSDHFSAIIPRNAQIPVTRAEVFYTRHEDQEEADIEVFQGEEERCSDNTEIGCFVFELRPAPAHSPLVVEFSYDLDGIIHVVVHQKGTDNRKEVTLSSRHREETEVRPAGDAVDNFILRKARRLAEGLPSGEIRQRLEKAASEYAEVLADDAAEGAKVDEIEDQLLELLDEVEDLAGEDES